MGEMVIIAIVYATAGLGAPDLGAGLPAGVTVPRGVQGIYLPELGAIQLDSSSRASVGAEAGEMSLQRGSARVAAEGQIRLDLNGAVAEVRRGVGYFEVSPASVIACAESGVLVVTTGDVGNDVPLGTCLTLSSSAPPATSSFDVGPAGDLRRVAEGEGPSAVALPSLVGTPDADLDDVEARHAAEIDRGARQESAACGCSEDSGGGGGSLDTGGSGPPSPDPDPPEPGALRIRIRVPTSRR